MPKLTSKLLSKLALISYFACWFAYFAWFWSRALRFDQLGNLWVGHVNLWGDWAAHFTMGSSLAFRDLFLVNSPFIVGAKFSYPYIANLLSAVLIRLGIPFFNAFLVPSFLMSCGLILALFYFFKTLFRSRAIAIIASLIFLLNGGIGYIYFAQDVWQSSQPLATFLNPPHEYTRLDAENIKWISVIDSMVIPQRAFNLGFPLTLLALGLVYSVIFHESEHSFVKLVGAGSILGLMPLIHTHSFLASGIIVSFWVIGSGLKLSKLDWPHVKPLAIKWFVVGSVTLTIAFPLFHFYFYQQTQGFLQWYPGWLAKEFNMNWWWFWFKNWGLTPLLGVASLVTIWFTSYKTKSWANLVTWLPFIVLFIVANLFLFQPFPWDNTKLIVWSSIGISGLTAFSLYHIWTQNHRPGVTTVLGRLVVVVVFVMTIASGTIDAYWIARTDLHEYQMYSEEELRLATWVVAHTEPNSVWLTGNNHNHWLFNLTGRQAVMTYPGWLWTHGYDYLQVEADVETMFENPQSSQLFEKYAVEYVVVGPAEQRQFALNEGDLQSDFITELKSDHVTIYRRP